MVVEPKSFRKAGRVYETDHLFFRAPLSDTREFVGCERIDVVLNKVSGKYLLVECWDQRSL